MKKISFSLILLFIISCSSFLVKENIYTPGDELVYVVNLNDREDDINSYLPESSTFGQLLSTLFGYNGNPSLAEVLAYIGYFIAIFVGLKLNTDAATIRQKAIS